MTPKNRYELQQLLSALCDGRLSAEEAAKLEERLAADAECRRMYLEYVDMHARLLLHPNLGTENPRASEEKPAAAPSVLPISGRVRKFPQVVRYGLVAAGTLAASLLVQLFLWPSTRTATAAAEPQVPEYVATLIRSEACTWDGQAPLRTGSRILAGDIRLQKGIARLRLDGGAELVIEGPTHLRIDSGSAASLFQGKVVFRGDKTASPFDLHTPLATLADLGTEYAVAVGPDGEEVHVFDGEVQRTPKGAGGAGAEYLTGGEARRYGAGLASQGERTELDSKRFAHSPSAFTPLLANPAEGLLAYEGFDYNDAEEFRKGKSEGGSGWIGSWTSDFTRPLLEGDRNLLTLDTKESLARRGTPSVGGSFAYTGFTKYWRRLANPVRLDTDGIYYLSFLFQRQGPPADPLNAVAIILWTDDDFQQKAEDTRSRLNIGVAKSNEVFTILQRVGSRTSLPLNYGDTYLLVAKIVAGSENPDQISIRVYGPDEPVDRDEPASWSYVGPPFRSDLVFNWLQLHINSKTRQAIDEVRLGTTWDSVTSTWAAGRVPALAVHND